ncbi:MAG: hypothetical protein PHU80_08465 [Kiritimatiellae bacterium]|nr:hypothetical protein [Kiritimatiellia bacterium]
MTQELQPILEKIQREGVDKARRDADKILSAAKAQADKLLEAAKAEAAKLAETARQDADSFSHRAEETVRQAARDTVSHVEGAVTKLFNNLLLSEVNTALSKDELVAELASEAVRKYLEGNTKVELAAGEKLAAVLRARLANDAAEGLEIVTDETTGSGFRVSLADGRVEHSFTGAAVADALAKQLRPRLAALMKQ